MKNLVYLLLAGSLFFACNQESSEGSKEASKADTQPKTDVTTTGQSAQAPSGDQNEQKTTAPDQTSEQKVVQNPPSGTDGSNATTTAQQEEGGNAAFSFEKTKHDFGKLTSEEPVEYSFKFKNTGTEPLIITEARGSCGCTVPEWPHEAIGVGETSEIQVSFHPNKSQSGTTQKTVKITANTNPPVTMLEIVSDVQIPK